MSAQEIIEQIKALPPEERRVIEIFMQTHGKDVPALAERDADDGQAVRYVDKATFQAAMEKVFVTHDELFRRLAQ